MRCACLCLALLHLADSTRADLRLALTPALFFDHGHTPYHGRKGQSTKAARPHCSAVTALAVLANLTSNFVVIPGRSPGPIIQHSLLVCAWSALRLLGAANNCQPNSQPTLLSVTTRPAPPPLPLHHCLSTSPWRPRLAPGLSSAQSGQAATSVNTRPSQGPPPTRPPARSRRRPSALQACCTRHPPATITP